jgi:hypothetical protein
MSSLTENTTLDDVTHDLSANTLTVTWRDHIFKDGVEIDSARVARVKTYTDADKDAFTTDLGADAQKYLSLFN